MRALPASLAAALLATAGCSSEPAPAPEPPVEARPAASPKAVSEVEPAGRDPAKLALFGKLPDRMESASNPLTDEKIALGRMLYYETRISKNHDLSCNSCHDLAAYGVDGKPFSEGHKKQLGGRNSPSTYNAAGHLAQFWDGRAADVEEQAKGPVLNPVEMAMPADIQVVAVLRSIPGYVEAFARAFPGEQDPVTYDNFGKAVGAFERKLVTPSRLDRYLAGDDAALTEAERAGLDAFVATGCGSCHMGPYVGGAMYQKAGLVKPWPNEKDVGRSGVTRNEAERFFFKVPSLRNVEKTAPYFHDSSSKSLEDAVKVMARHQLGKELDDAATASIVGFLKTLTGELPKQYIARPELPASGPSTPEPDPT